MMLVTKNSCSLLLLACTISVLTPMQRVSAAQVDRHLLRKFFGCPPCQPENCILNLAYPGCELVLEPGVCACCQMCAKRLGESCGLGAGRCGRELSCRPLPNDVDPIGSILSGNAVCIYRLER